MKDNDRIKVFLRPAAISILQAAGGNAEHTALVVKDFTHQIKLIFNFT